MHKSYRVFAVLASLVGLPISAQAQISITTERYDNARTGANLNETQLSPSNVGVNTFGKLWSYTVSGSVQAQPLYVAGLNMGPKGTHNVLFVVTMNDVIYAFDADSSSGTPLWSLDLTTQVAGSTPVPITDIVPPDLNIVGNVGIESTPQIDLSTDTMYLVARTKEPNAACGTVDGNYCQRLHALDITSGVEKFGGPVVIQGSVAGSGTASSGGILFFDPKIENQRTSLALAGGQIFIAWGSHEDFNPYHGWIMSYNFQTLAQTGIFCTTPDGAMSGVWMSGRAPTVDSSGNVYFTVGNGDWNGTRNFGDSILKFSSASAMSLLDWFTPDNWSSIGGADLDYGSSGPMLIPGTDLVTAGGKFGTFYVMHTGSLGHEQSGNGQIVQSLPNNGGEIKAGPIYWNRTGGVGPWLYVWSNGTNTGGDVIKAYHFNGTTFDPSTVSQGLIISPTGASGGVLTLSANGSTPGSGIVWSSMPLQDSGDHGIHQGILRALNADDLTKELWNSRMNASRDDIGNWPKYSPPTVNNGRVYMASFPADGIGNTAVNVYGLISSTPDFTVSASPSSRTVSPLGVATYTISTGSVSGFSGQVNLGVSGLPTGATASFSSSTIGAPGSATLTVDTTSAIGVSTLTITATSGSLSHSTAVALSVSTVSAGQGAISIDFVGGSTAMAPSEVAGVIPKSNWNSAAGPHGSNQPLMDETGTNVGATVTWSSSNVWNLPVASTPGDSHMMNGYLDTVGQNAIVSVAGLHANSAGYDIYVYADGDNSGATLTGTYQLSTPSQGAVSIALTDAAGANFNGTYTQANNSNGNYAKFFTSNTSFTLTGIPGPPSGWSARAPVNGIQIVPHAPAPDFSLNIVPTSQSVTAGSSATFVTNIAAINGFTGTVTFSVAGLPSGATANFTPATVTGNGSSNLAVGTATSIPAGTSTPTVSATSGALVHTANISLIVSPPPGVSTPSLSPAGGTYSTAQVVTVTDTTAGATMYYTTDGTVPSSSSTKYTLPINIASTTTLNVIAVSGSSKSSVATATYTIGPLNLISQLTLSPSTLLGGTSSQGTINLSSSAPSGGTRVALSSNNTGAATVPTNVTVPAGQTSATFTVTTVSGASANVTISASAGTGSASAKLTVQALVPRAAWTLLFVDSQETVGENAPATNAFDGNPNTFWHTQWKLANPPPPHEIQINLGAAYTLNGFAYLPRQDGCSNGTVKQFEFYVSADGVNWGTPVASGTFNYGSAILNCNGGAIPSIQRINFTAATGRYIRFRALSEVNGNPWTSAAEINVLH